MENLTQRFGIDPPLIVFALAVLALIVTIVVMVRLRGREVITRSAAVTSWSPPSGTDPELAALLSRGQTIQAIKLVRDRTGMGLKEAKDYVEALRAGQSLGALPEPAISPAERGDLDVAVRELVAEGQAIQAIKLVRDRTGMGLKEAKDYVEAIGAGQPRRQPGPGTEPHEVPGLDAAARALVSEGKPLEAIKLVRKHSGLSLPEAKDYVERLSSGEQQPQ